MPNIYLRVPQYVAAFYRHREQNNKLSAWQPVAFEEFSFENTVLLNGMVDDSNKKVLTVLCYSEQSWKNILVGKLPRGGKTVFMRDKDKWPTPREIVTLEGRTLKQNEELFDYLCIALPREMAVGGKVIKTPRTTSLDGQTAQRLSNMLRNEFYQAYYEWVTQLKNQFDRQHMTISKAECMERFFAQYEIPITPGSRQQESLRMSIKRLSWRVEKVNKHRREQCGEYYDYLTTDNTKFNNGNYVSEQT